MKYFRYTLDDLENQTDILRVQSKKFKGKASKAKKKMCYRNLQMTKKKVVMI